MIEGIPSDTQANGVVQRFHDNVQKGDILCPNGLKVIEKAGYSYNDEFKKGKTIGEELLTPTRIYVEVLDVLKRFEVHGMAQRGGSVVSAVRFGEKVFSPLSQIHLFWLSF